MIAYFFVRVISALVGVLPLGVALALGRALGSIGFVVVRIRRRVVLSNIAHVLGEKKTPAEIRAIAHEAYRQVAMTFVEVLRSSTGARDLCRNVEFGDLGRFEEVKKRRAPLIILQPHAGNFDLAAYAFAERGFPHHTVMKAVKNARVNRLIVTTRERHGVTVHLKNERSYDELLAALRAGDWIGLLPDQNARTRGVTVDWLGRPASIFKGPALLHLATGAEIVVAVDERLAGGRRHHTHFRFLDLDPRTGDEAQDVRRIMQRIADAMAEQILRNPAQYFWFHRLWGKEVAGAG